MKQLLKPAAAVFAAAVNSLRVYAANDVLFLPTETPGAALPEAGAYNERVVICAASFAALALLIFIIITIMRIKKRRRRAKNAAAESRDRVNTEFVPTVPNNVSSDTEMRTVAGPGAVMHMARLGGDFPDVYDIAVREPVIIGSAPSMSNIVVGNNCGVRPRHCMIAYENNRLVIVEHAPETLVNGVPLRTSRYILAQGDKLKLGDVTFRISWRQ